MNKILNWTFGACFRTLGRFLAIFIVGVLLIFIGSKIGVELPSWLALRVDALEPDTWTSSASDFTWTIDAWDCGSSGKNCILNEHIYYTEPGVRLYTGNYEVGIGLFKFRNYNSEYIFEGGNTYLFHYTFSMENKDFLDYTTFEQIMENTYIDFYYYNTEPRYANAIPLDTKNVQVEFVDSPESLYSFQIYVSAYVPEGINAQYLNFGFVVGPYEADGVVSNVSLLGDIIGFNGGIDYSTERMKFSVEKGATSVIEGKLDNIEDAINDTNNKLDNIEDSITDDDISDAEDSASSFFNDFTTETFGLTSIITAPLNAINSLISSTCSPLVLPLPYVDKSLSLPCMSVIYKQYFGAFFSIYQLITNGLISYYIIVRIFNLVKDFKNPEHDEIEVLDL